MTLTHSISTGRGTSRLYRRASRYPPSRTGSFCPPFEYAHCALPTPLLLPTNRITAVVYLKNRVSRGWFVSDEFPQNKQIPEDEKQRFRDRLLPLLASSPPQIRSQLVPVLQKILHYDFPDKWPAFINITVQLLNTNDASNIFAGLQCLLAVCRVFRFKSGDKREDFDKIVEATFPRLLVIGQGLVHEMSEEAGEMLHIVLKAYKHATFVGLPYVV